MRTNVGDVLQTNTAREEIPRGGERTIVEFEHHFFFMVFKCHRVVIAHVTLD